MISIPNLKLGRLKLFSIFAVSVILGGGAYFLFRRESQPSISTPLTSSPILELIKSNLQRGELITEVQDPGFSLGADVHKGQIGGYFRLGGVYFALARNRSLNVVLDIPQDFEVSFVGVLLATKSENQWAKFLQVTDANPNDKNNPYYLWSDGEKIFLTVVDHHGAGSGEGVLKLIGSRLGVGWEVEDCLYFGANNYRSPSEDGDYFSFSKKLSKHRKLSRQDEDCGNVTIRILTQ